MKSRPQIAISEDAIFQELGTRKLLYFAMATNPKFVPVDFHKNYYSILDAFADGQIKKLIIQAPPQHGKSEGSSRNLPAYVLGKDPDIKAAICSYDTTLAMEFLADVKRIMQTDAYQAMFTTRLPDASSREKNTDKYFRLANGAGYLIAAGRNKGITGKALDLGILDDLYKNASEANSPTIRESAWQFYTKSFLTRLHNNARQLIVFTRWHEDDVIGRIEKIEKVHTVTTLAEALAVPKGEWVRVNYPAIKIGAPTELDPRQPGEALWSKRHNLARLASFRALDTIGFEAMFQGNPTTTKGLLYGSGFKIWKEAEKPTNIIAQECYVDTKESGTDNLCAIFYERTSDGLAIVNDVYYTDENGDVTEIELAKRIVANNTPETIIESNAGGVAYARGVRKLMPTQFHKITEKHQDSKNNKESKILTNAPSVMNAVIMPENWNLRWPKFYTDIMTFKRLFKANAHDDAADVLSEIAKRLAVPNGTSSAVKAHKRR